MAIIDKKISSLIPQQFTEFFRQERSDIVDFVKKYYEFLESVQVDFVNTEYNEPFLLSETGDTFIQEKGPRETFVLESIRHFGKPNQYVDHFEKGEIITGQTSGAQLYVTARVRRYKLPGIYHRMPDGSEMKDSVHPYDSVFGYYLNDNFFIDDEILLGETTRVSSTYLKSNRNVLNLSRDIENSLNIDFAELAYVNKFYDEIAPYIPRDLDYDKNLLLKHIKDLYTSKGNEESFKFLFNLIYPDANLNFYYPKVDMLRVSDGTWIVESALRINFNDVINREFFVDGIITGQYSGATAYISSLRNVGTVGLQSLEIIVKNINGNFIIGEQILGYNFDEEVEFGGKLEGVLSGLIIENSGKNYQIGDLITVVGGTSSNARAKVTALKDGVIDTIAVIDPGDGYFVGDSVIFDNTLTGGSTLTSGSGAEAIVESIIPTYQFKDIIQVIRNVRFVNLNDIDYGGVFNGHDVNTHLLSDTTTTYKITFDPAVSGTLLKRGDFISVDGTSNTVSAIVIGGDGSTTSETGANTCLISLRTPTTFSDISSGDDITAWDNITGRTDEEIDNSIELVLSGATGTISSIEEVSETPPPFGDLADSGDITGSQYFGALDYTIREMGGISTIEVINGGTGYIDEPIVSIQNPLIKSYENDIDSVGAPTKILKLNSNSGLSFEPGNKIKGSLALSIGDTGSDFIELEEVRGLTSDAIGLYIKSLGSSSEFNLHSSEDTFLISQLPTWFLSLTQDSLDGTIAHGDIITGDDSGAIAYVLYDVTDSGVTGQASDYGSTDILRIIPLTGRFIRNETITSSTSVTAEILDNVNYLDGPHLYDFVYGETILGLDSDVQRTVVTPADTNDPVFIDPPVGLIVGPITDTSNSTYSEIRISELDSIMEFDDDHYIVEYRENLNSFLGAAKGQLQDTNSVVIDYSIKGDYTSRLEVDQITIGAISTIEITNFGQGFTNLNIPSVAIDSEEGTGAILTPFIDALAVYPGKYIGTQGLISGSSKIQDSYFYQSFSYVLRTEVDLAGSEPYQSVIKKILHPAGLAVFGEVLLQSELSVLSNIGFGIQVEIGLYENVQVNTYREHMVEVFSSSEPYSLNLRVKNEYPDYDNVIAENWDILESDGSIVLRSFGLDINLTYEDGNNILIEARDKGYLLPEIMFPDMRPADIPIFFIMESEGSNPYERVLTYIVDENSTTEYPNRFISEKYDSGDVTIDVGPEPREIFDNNSEIEIHTLLNNEVILDYETEIEVDLVTTTPIYSNTEIHVEIHQKEHKEVDANNQILVDRLTPNPEVQFNNFYGHRPLTDGPIKNWEDEVIEDSFTILRESADVIQENYFRNYIVSEDNDNFNWISGIPGFEIEGRRIITEDDYYITSEQSFFEEKQPTIDYNLITEDGHRLITDNLVSIIYEDVQIFYGLQLFKGRETPDEFKNLLDEDWKKSSRLTRITSLGTFTEDGIQLRHIPVSLNYRDTNYRTSLFFKSLYVDSASIKLKPIFDKNTTVNFDKYAPSAIVKHKNMNTDIFEYKFESVIITTESKIETLFKSLYVDPVSIKLKPIFDKNITVNFDKYAPSADVKYKNMNTDIFEVDFESDILVSRFQTELYKSNQWVLSTLPLKKINIQSYNGFRPVEYDSTRLSKRYTGGLTSLADGPIDLQLNYSVEFYLPLNIPNGLRLFNGDEILSNKFEIFSNDILSGTCSFINNSKTVEGLNTFFTTELSVGDSIIVKETGSNDAQKFIVSNIIDDTHLEINIPFTGSYNDEIFKEVTV